MDINAITSDKVDHFAQRDAVSKAEHKNKIKQAVREKLEGDGLRIGKSVRLSPQAAKPGKLSSRAVKGFADAVEAKDKKKSEARRMSMLRKINLYSRILPQFVRRDLRPSMRLSEEELTFELQEIRNNIAAAQAPEGVRGAMFFGLRQVEFLVMKKGYNPLELDIEGLADAVESDPSRLEPELSEMSVELEALFHSAWYVRLAYKLAQITMLYSAAKKNPELFAPPGKVPEGAEEL